MAKVVVVYHSYRGVTDKMVQDLIEGVEQAGGEVTRRLAGEADIADLLTADAFILACGQPFNTLAGPVKTFIEKLWLSEDKGKLAGKPFTFLLNGNSLPEGTAANLKKIAGYFQWSQDFPEVLSVGADVESALARCREVGKALAGIA